MSIKVDEELKSISQKNNTLSEPLSEIKQLLEGDRQQDLNTMRYLAGNSSIIQNEKNLSQTLELLDLNKKYGDVYSVKDIRELAGKYRLRFQRSGNFTGKMDIQAIAKLKQFAKDSGLAILDEETLSRRFYILAPVESFSLTTRTIKDVKQEERERKLREKDPVLFYKIDDTHYRMIHKWGSDFSITRRILGWYWEAPENYMKVQLAITVLMHICLTFLINSWVSTFVFHYDSAHCFHFVDCKTAAEAASLHTIMFDLLFMVLALIPVLCYYYNKKNLLKLQAFKTGFFTKYNWDSDYHWKMR